MRLGICVALMVVAAACGEKPVEQAATDTTAATETETQRDRSDRSGQDSGAFFPVSFDPETGGLMVTLPAADDDGLSLRAIHSAGVTSGLGSNPVGLDRGYQDAGRIIAFRRIGKKVVIEQENWRYRASADNALEKKAVLDSFASSLLWAGEVKDDNPDGSFTADLAGFLTSDVLDLSGWLKGAEQGEFKIDEKRSFTDPKDVLVFPDNVEIDTVITLSSAKPGAQVTATAADGRSPSLKIHHSFVRLPDPGYEPRIFDPRTGAINVLFYDFSAPLDEPIVQSFARRFRLERTDPAATSGPVKKPIIFYVDSGAPKEVRDALIEGASWWAEAFEAAGFEDAFRVEVLPDDVHPFDVRYNVIQWTHRQTRGWSYGGGVVDPRTGEMLKGHVILGSQRVRQDRMIFEGLAGAAKSGTGSDDDPVQVALARIRQLSAHEVGHPLGFAHNFAASQNNRASVMDYPAPLVRPDGNGGLDLSQAYASGIGAWDKFTVEWLYSQFPEGADEKAELRQIILDAYGSGLKFVADSEGRSVGAAHPDGSVWDNGDNPVAMLDETMRVRQIALSNFGQNVIQDDQPISQLRAVIVPVYLYHRYQVAAAAKLIGGYRFDYAVKGDDREGGETVPAARQRAALASLLRTLDPQALDLPDETLNLLTPAVRTFTGFPTGENFEGDTGPMFDILSAADAASTLTLDALLHPSRLARLVETERRGGDQLGVSEMLTQIERQVFSTENGRAGEIQRTIQTRYVSTLIDRANGDVTPAVTARINAYLKSLRNRISPGLLDGASPSRAHRDWLVVKIEQHLNRPAPTAAVTAPEAEIPPGSPIGAGAAETCWHCE